MKKSFFKKYWLRILGVIIFLLVFPLTAFVAYTIGLAVGQHKLQDLVEANIEHIYATEIPTDISSEELDFAPFWKAWQLLDERFVHSTATTTEVVFDQEKIWGAIQGLAASYDDPYTVFFPPEETELFESDIQGEFSGIGIEIGIRDGLLTVVAPLSGTPADKAGLLPKDIIIEIDGRDSTNISTESAVKAIRGKRGTPVVLTIAREGETEPLEISIIRDIIQVPTTESYIEDGVFIIKFYSFSAKSASLFRDELQKFANSDTDYLIIDLRGNPGGFLQAAISVASWFVPEGEVLVTETFENKREDRIHVSSGPKNFPGAERLVILTNAGSASAAEILAGSLRDYRQALLVGDNTFGKGSVQELIEITPETALKVTIAKWILPNGEHISEEGIEPHIQIEQNDPENDSQLSRAIEIIQRSDFETLFDTIPSDLQQESNEE